VATSALATTTTTTTALSSSSSTATTTTTATTTATTNPITNYFNLMESKRKLILLLVGNELDRIAAWNNPQNVKCKHHKKEKKKNENF
jgi:hypothetical protein